MIFTDEKGQEYEADKKWKGQFFDNYIVIKPVTQSPKWQIGYPVLMYDGGDYTFAVTFQATKDQAQLIKKCCEELMRCLTEDTALKPPLPSFHSYPPTSLLNLMNDTRNALMENK